MANDREDLLEQALIVVLSLNKDAGLSLDGVVKDVNRAMSENGKYRHYCPQGAEEICGIVKKLVEETKAKCNRHGTSL